MPMVGKLGSYFGKDAKVTSGYRSPAKNKSVGGAKKSQHLSGNAVDIQVPGVPPEEVARVARQMGFGGVGVYKGHVHVDVGPKRSWNG